MTKSEKEILDTKITSLINVNRKRLETLQPYNCTNKRQYYVIMNKCINYLYCMRDYRVFSFVELKTILAYISKMSY